MNTIRMLAILAISSICSFAASPVGTLVSSDTFYLDGTAISAPGVSSWLLTDGDVIRTGSSAATIILRDQSRVTVAANSEVRLVKSGSSANVNVIAGHIFSSRTGESAASTSSLQVHAEGLAAPVRYRGPQPVPTPSTITP
jgi:hypothetical protein